MPSSDHRSYTRAVEVFFSEKTSEQSNQSEASETRHLQTHSGNSGAAQNFREPNQRCGRDHASAALPVFLASAGSAPLGCIADRSARELRPAVAPNCSLRWLVGALSKAQFRVKR